MNGVEKVIDFTEALSRIAGKKNVITCPEEKLYYERDNTGDLHFSCDVVVKPATADEVSRILKICNDLQTPVTLRGGGTGVTGGALPTYGGIVLSLERLNKILEIDTFNRWALVEAGVITQHLYDKAHEKGLYFPLIPGSGGSSFIGGNVSTGAGSPMSAKYGTLKDYVINLEVVLPTGEIIWTGANANKNSSGLNLTTLFVGSEGTLGVITKVLLKLLPLPSSHLVLLSAFNRVEDALDVVNNLAHSSLTPAAVELVCEDALRLTAQYLDQDVPLLHPEIKAHLLIAFEGMVHSEVLNDAEKVSAMIEKFTPHEVLVGDDDASKKRLWKLRHGIGEAMTHNGLQYRDVDVCVPRSKVQAYLQGVHQVCVRHNLKTASFGHVFDGNLHTMVLLPAGEKMLANPHIDLAVTEIYQLAIALGGAVSGEHGIGLLQRDFLDAVTPQPKMKILRSIKKAFDPNNIINRDKIYTIE